MKVELKKDEHYQFEYVSRDAIGQSNLRRFMIKFDSEILDWCKRHDIRLSCKYVSNLEEDQTYKIFIVSSPGQLFNAVINDAELVQVDEQISVDIDDMEKALMFVMRWI